MADDDNNNGWESFVNPTGVARRPPFFKGGAAPLIFKTDSTTDGFFRLVIKLSEAVTPFEKGGRREAAGGF